MEIKRAIKQLYKKNSLKTDDRLLKSDHLYSISNGNAVWISYMFNYETVFREDYFKNGFSKFHPNNVSNFSNYKSYMQKWSELAFKRHEEFQTKLKLNSQIDLKSYGFDNTNDLNDQSSSWSFWSEGTISIGKVGDDSASSAKNINTSAITLGADKKGEDNIMRGIALRFGTDDIDVGTLGSALDMSSFGLTFYSSKPKGEQRFTDHLLGMSFINSNLINNSGSASTDGERYGEQLYGSLSLRDTFSKNRLNFTPKLKINYGITHLGAYKETGSTGLNLEYEDQYIGNFTSSLGTSLDNTYDFEVGSFIPYFDFEYYADMSPASKQKFSYVSNGESFTLENIESSTHNFSSGIGFDFISDNGLTLMTKYTRDQAQNHKNDSFIIALDYRGSQRSSYAMSFQDSSAQLSHNKELNDFKVNIDSHYDFFKDDPDYGVYLKISNVN